MGLLQDISHYWTEQLDPRVADLLFVASSYQVPLIIFAYLYFVLVCGPRFMKNKSPYSLETFMKLYNIVQIVGNGWLLYDCINVVCEKCILLFPVENIRLCRDGYIYIKKEGQSGVRSTFIPSCIYLIFNVGRRKILYCRSHDIYKHAKHLYTHHNVHILLPSGLRTKCSKSYCTYETMDNYSTNGAICCDNFVYITSTHTRLQGSE
ncbi:uncharacterized protein LOC105425277 isoform X1 [Pogonomyrmex barbatus]|uniref:Uncharacterized protein LOC105425277 isoform X1 n=1 Tax=Pogonomyrmex barbatus TaxID=144034 RepID=A0A6I9WR00_9HYME|nr:uncharacterized protein LOC105425277 isoform X1 [Pogonomyrmex barbatus]